MRFLYILLLILTSCISSTVHKVETSKIVVLYNRRFIESEQTLYFTKDIIIQVVYSTGKSRGLTPRIYSVGNISVNQTPRSSSGMLAVGPTLLPNNPYELIITIKPRSEGTILFIFESKYIMGDKKIIHFKSID